MDGVQATQEVEEEEVQVAAVAVVGATPMRQVGAEARDRKVTGEVATVEEEEATRLPRRQDLYQRTVSPQLKFSPQLAVRTKMKMTRTRTKM